MSTSTDLDEVVMALAFAIEDPCGLDALELARALLRLAQTVPAKDRKTIVSLCQAWTRSFESEERENVYQ
jgi:hypothetical protein